VLPVVTARRGNQDSETSSYAGINRIRFKGFTDMASQALLPRLLRKAGHPQVCIASIGRLNLLANKIEDRALPLLAARRDVS
jgi:hypothetical protein